jgi:quaternary ammonium compound-resistance protein SugE
VAWFYLFVAGVLETAWAVSMKVSEGFTKPLPTIVTLGAMIGSFGFLSMAMRSLPLGSAYAIWTGIGTLDSFMVGAIFLREHVSGAHLAAVALILSGIVLMKIATQGVGA